MIYTITFNPALDYIVKMDDFNLGHVNRSTCENVYAGGKGINVSIVLNNLGVKSKALGFIAGFTGEEIEREVREFGCDTDFIKLKNGMSRINVKIKADVESEINGGGPEISDEALHELYGKLDKLSEGDILVLAGSIPKTMPVDIYERIMESLQDKGVKFIVDTTGESLLKVLKYKPFLIKPNNHELAEMFNVELNTTQDIIFYAEKLKEMGAQNVLISMGKDGALLVSEDNQVLISSVAKGEVVNSVGAGDSMVAGFISGYLKSQNYEDALRLGAASGGATAFSSDLATREFIDKLVKEIKIEKIK